MSRSESAAFNRRRLKSALRALRTKSEHTQRTVAMELDWTPSKLMRIEGGQVGVSKTDLMALLQFYGVSDAEQIHTLVEMARRSNGRTLSAQFRDGLSKDFADFLEQEEAASLIRQYENKFIPGPLQAAGYAQAVIRSTLWPPPEDFDRLVEIRVKARLGRGELLRQTDSPRAVFIMDESVLWRRVGNGGSNGNDVMLEQLEHLRAMAAQPNVVIQFMKADSGVYPAFRGPFVLLDFDDAEDGTLLYRENPDGQVLVKDDPHAIAPYVEEFTRLEREATPPDALDRCVEVALDVHRQQPLGLSRLADL